MQGGCSEATSPDYPLFTSGTELLVFLRDYDGSGEKYHPITDYNTVLYVVYDEAGDRYFLDSFGTMSAQDTCVPGRTTLDSAQLAEMTADADPVLAEAISSQGLRRQLLRLRGIRPGGLFLRSGKAIRLAGDRAPSRRIKKHPPAGPPAGEFFQATG